MKKIYTSLTEIRSNDLQFFAIRIRKLFLLSLFLFFNLHSNAQTLITIGTGTGVPSVGTNPGATAEACSPYGVNVGSGGGGKKVQMIYTTAMINTAMTTAGYTPGASFISTVGYNITGIVTTTFVNQNYTVKMANVAQADLSGGYYTGAMTTVYGAVNTTFPSTGWFSLAIGTPFLWDGTSNLCIEVCYNYTGVGLITTYGGCQYTAVGGNNHMGFAGDLSTSCATAFPGSGSLTNRLCNVRLTVTSATPCSGAPAVSTASNISVCSGSTGIVSLSGLVGAAGYTYLWKQSSAPAYPGTFSAASGTNNAATYTTPTTLPFFPTYYVCEVTCSNSGLMTPSIAGSVSLTSFLSCYCVPSYAVGNGGTRGIVQVILNGTPAINNTTTINNVSPFYSLYTGASPVSNAGLSLSTAYTLQVKVGTQLTAINNAGAWIDYNQNGVFETTEYLGSITNAAASSTTNINFTVPGTALTGTTAMRVRHRYGAAVTSADACTNFTGATGTGGAGETEDYRVSITGAACTGTPTSGSVAAVTSTVCPNGTSIINLTGQTSGVSGITLQWQVSNDNISYSNVSGGSGATTTSYTTGTLPNATSNPIIYYYKCLITCTNGGGNSIQAVAATVTVNPTPIVTILPSLITSCPSDANIFTASGASTYTWTPNTNLSATTGATVTANPNVSITYTITGTSLGCSGINTATVTVNPGIISITPSSPLIIAGGNVNLTASATGTGVTYKWSPCSSLSSATGATVTASPNVSTTYTVIATDITGCTRSAVVIVTVNSGTSGIINCPTYSYSYVGPSGTNTTNNWTTASSLGTPITIASGTGMSMNDAVYPNQSTVFNFDYNGITYNSIGVSTNGFIWFGTGSPAINNYLPLSSTTGQTGTIDGIISVMGGNMQPRAASSTLKIVTFGSIGSRVCVIEWFNIQVSPATSGSDYQIRLYETTNNIELWYNSLPYPFGFESWAGQVGIRGTTTADYLNRSVTCSAGGNWQTSTAGGTNTASCYMDGGICSTFGFWPPNGQGGFSGGAGSTFRYAPIYPTPVISASGAMDLCPSASVNLTTGAGASYQWYLNGSVISGATNQSLNGVTGAGSYTVKVPASGCNRTSYTAVITNNANVTASVNIVSSVSPLCNASSANFTATPINAGCSPNYQWKLNGVNVGTNSLTYSNSSLVAGDQIQVIMTSNALCASPIPALSNIIIDGISPSLVTPAPVSNVCPAATFNLSSVAITDNNNTIGSYTYYSTLANANAASSPISSVISSTGTYFIRKTTVSGCFGVTSISVTINTCCSTGTWTGLTNTDWHIATNWCNNIIPTSSTDVIIPGAPANQPEIGYGAAFCHNLTIADPFAYVALTAGTLSVSGDIVNNGSFSNPNGMLILNGSLPQTIPALYCYDVKIDNNTGVVLTGDLIITNNLNLFNGIVSTGGSIITVNNPSSSAITGFSNTNYINGRLIRYINNGVFDFPIGDATNYELISLTINNLSPTFYLLGEYFPDNFTCSPIPNAGGGPYVNGSPITNLLNAGYWTITPDNQPSGGTYDIQLNEKGASNIPGTPAYCAVIKRDDCFSNWQSLGVHNNATQSINSGVVTAVRSGLTSFSDFGIGFGGIALPVQLSDFTADYYENNLNSILKWTTASELNCDYFDLEVSTELDSEGGFIFRKIGQVDGSGTSIINHDYSFVDRELNKAGTRYYRLKEVDMNGEFSYSQIVSLVFGSEPVILSTLYPNPTNHFINYELFSAGNNGAKISITNLLGQEMFTEQLKLKDGINKLNVDVEYLAEGVYFINIRPAGKTEIHRKFEKYSE